jgi:hypothetical protein
MRSLEWIISANEKAYQEQQQKPSGEDCRPQDDGWYGEIAQQTLLQTAMKICIQRGCSAQEALDRARAEL